MVAPPSAPRRPFVLAVSSNKGGVGKTTVAANLAIYLRALREELPILITSLDDQKTVDRMFSIGSHRAGGRAAANLKHAWAQRTFETVIQLGEYGVHYVPSPPDVSLLKARAGDPLVLRRMIDRTDWPGIFILDTKGDLEALTLNAFHAADRILIPIADWASLDEAAKAFGILERSNLDTRKARILLTLVDRRTRVREGGQPLVDVLRTEVEERGWPLYKTQISRSPRVELLNSGMEKPLSILHHARGTVVHGQMRVLAEEVLDEMGAGERLQALADRATESDSGGQETERGEVFRKPKSWTDELWGAFFRR